MTAPDALLSGATDHLAVVLALVAGVLGLVVGSFLNVVVWRVPRGESVVSPPSACPRCGHRVRARDNVPVLSWLALRGRCRDCGEPISRRYPLVELVTGVLFAVTAGVVGWSWSLPAVLYLVAISVALTLIDLDVKRLPDRIVLPAYVVAPVLLALASWNPGGPSDWGALGRAAVGCVVLYVVYFVLVLVYPAGMGFGDVKLAGVLGLYLGWVGWGALVVGWFAAFLLGGAFGLVLIVLRRVGPKSGIAFGPWMILGAFVGLAVGESLWSSYLGLL
ncbi:peptidase A24A domain protein [Cellulomonas flavigena DSM 20109]|uniref:Prepilin leader peptidase/N-methyltransferase n=1 Tax=Cellulomonas flavigena (strain ATCC 482 / DSM 20109 / BCRC 11376 / JCM 18109 / NBRC 3775 / NCIMB 8073 / NRS 134) TaxID=446466 RepID=D5UER6_CELFN|nr:A24 family peptidase [Cellulomonas flavigena]ADG74726.1 peptidase A24A domain protein [Cellulomonas flavigena DSM 20109]